MADNTIVLQGNFTSTGTNVIIPIPSDVDWMYVYNMTALTQAAENLGSVFYWQRNMTPGSGVVWTKLAGVANDPVTIGALAAGTGFQTINQGYTTGVSAQLGNSTQWSAPVAFTSTSNATSVVVDTASTAGLQVGSIVMLSQNPTVAYDATALLGIPFQVTDVVLNTSFTLQGALSQDPGAGTDGSWRYNIVPNTFYPEFCYIIDISTAGAVGVLNASATQPVVETSFDHGYQIGQNVTFNVVSKLNGMTQINALTAPIIALDPALPNAFQVFLPTVGFTPFQFPTNAQVAAGGNNYTPATVVPAGMNTAAALNAVPQANILSDATVNVLVIGMQLLGGNTTANENAGPAGALGDQIFWQSGKAYSTNGM